MHFSILSCVLALGSAPHSAPVLSVQIASPLDNATVSGTVPILGTSTDVGTGRVTVSIDGGPWLVATGTDSWSFDWDSSTVADGVHEIRARAKDCLLCPPVFDSINVNVQSSALSVQIADPSPGDLITGTLVVTGTSNGATGVSIAVDGGAPENANGTNPWDAVIEAGALLPGPHTLVATAVDGSGGMASSSVSFLIGDPVPGVQDFTYLSSVDGAPLTSKLWVPSGFDPLGAAVPLVIDLHGAGGVGNFAAELANQLDLRGWVGIAPDGREWALADLGCTWNFSPAYIDSADPNVGPGEQDIYDAIQWALDNLPIDTDRIFLTGGSYGGRGAYLLGLKNPGFFAAIAPRDPPIDMYEIFARRGEPCICKEGMLGGRPGDSPFVDTMYTTTSGRFLIENAYNLPVFHTHGTQDTVASNTLSNHPFLHGWHITVDPSWSGDFVSPSTLAEFGNSCLTDPSLLPYVLGFGHTPTLTELSALHPGAYPWGFLFTPVGHTTDPRWFTGTPLAPGFFGTESLLSPGNHLGIFEFFDRYSRVDSPETLVYKTYTDTHRSAYWASIDITTPWLDLPGAIRATRNDSLNRLDLELVRVALAEIDLDRAQLSLDQALTIELQELVEPGYDPNLLAPGEGLSPSLALRAAGLSGNFMILRDGTPFTDFSVSAGELLLGPIPVTAPTTLVITPNVGDSFCFGNGGDQLGCTDCPCGNEASTSEGGCLNAENRSAVLHRSGLASLTADTLRFEMTGGSSNTFAILSSGASRAPANAVNPCFGLDTGIPSPTFDGLRCVVQQVQRHGTRPTDTTGSVGSTTNGWGPPNGPPGGLAAQGAFTAGQVRHFQVVYREDPTLGCGTGQNTTQGVTVTFAP